MACRSLDLQSHRASHVDHKVHSVAAARSMFFVIDERDCVGKFTQYVRLSFAVGWLFLGHRRHDTSSITTGDQLAF